MIEPYNIKRPYRAIGEGPFTVIGGNTHPLEIRGEHLTIEAAQAEAQRLNDWFEDMLQPRTKLEMQELFRSKIAALEAKP